MIGASAEGLTRAVIERLQAVIGDLEVPADGGRVAPLPVIRTAFDPKKYVEDSSLHSQLPAVIVKFSGESQAMGEFGYEERIGKVDVVLALFVEEYGDDELVVSLTSSIFQDFLAQRIFGGRCGVTLTLPLYDLSVRWIK
jgi:hypothetical protein